MIGKLAIGVFLVSGLAFAQKVPRDVFNADKIEEAKAEAAKSGKKIAVITTEIGSSCPKCVAGTEAAFDKLDSDYVMILDDDTKKAKYGALPQDIKQMTYPIYKEKGNITPIVTVFSPEMDRVLGGACYKQISGDGRKWIKNLDAEVAAKAAEPAPASAQPKPKPKEGGKAAAAGNETEEACEVGGMREWTDARGRKMEAEFVASDGQNVTFKLKGGKVIEYPLLELSAASQAVVAECAK